MQIRELQKKVYVEYVKNGYAKNWNKYVSIGDIAELGLITSEVAEAMEAIRKHDINNLSEECADIAIRVMNFMSRKDLDLQSAILEKNKKNLKRGKLHGKQV